MPLNPVDTGARWRTSQAGKASGMQYQENVIADRGGFTLSRGVTHVSERESKAASGLIEKLSLHPVSLAGDSGNCWRNGTSRPASPSTPGTRPAWFPPRNSSTTRPSGLSSGQNPAPGQFPQAEPHLPVCGASERLPSLPSRLPPKQKHPYFTLTMYYPEYLRAKERNCSDAYRQELRRRQTIAEGTFASLDRLSWARTRLRGLWKVGCEGYMADLAHNVLELMRRLSRGVAPPGLPLPAAAETTESSGTQDDAVPGSPIPPQYRLRHSRLTKSPSSRTRQRHCRRRRLSQLSRSWSTTIIVRRYCCRTKECCRDSIHLSLLQRDMFLGGVLGLRRGHRCHRTLRLPDGAKRRHRVGSGLVSRYSLPPRPWSPHASGPLSQSSAGGL